MNGGGPGVRLKEEKFLPAELRVRVHEDAVPRSED